MHSGTAPRQDLVLVGGGHAHALVLRSFAMSPPARLRITLISPAAFTPYSGMLPGLLAGHYRFEETHIDLVRLCQWAGVRFLPDTVLAMDPQRQVLECRDRGEVAYDLLSLDIGSQPELDSVPGAREHAVPVKPVAGLWSRWRELAECGGLDGQRIALVGGGAGSVELALAMAHHLKEQRVQIDLYCGGAEVLEGYSNGARRTVEREFERQRIGLHKAHRAARVEAGTLFFGSGAEAAFDTLIWSTGAAASPWVAASGLPVDERGFLLVDDTLQSTAAANVFAAGDIATQHRHPRPKAGVYAVRQGPVLADNLRALAAGEPLKTHKPQRDFLSLLALGPRRAVAQRNGLSLSGAWVWRWKDRIDREFMRRFSELPERKMPPPAADTSAQAPCGGCGAKVAADSLGHVLAGLRERYPAHSPDRELDDTTRISVQGDLLQTLDALRALVDDPWRMGRIAAQHALSDIYASGAQPHSALALVTLPFADPALVQRDLAQVLEGALSIFAAADCRLLGGHSMQGPELQLGFLVNGRLGADAALGKRGAQPGDVLILGKALGSGALFAAHMQSRADGRDVEAALAQMEQSNGLASRIARRFAATALTDVTGFGLAGHLLEMLHAPTGAQLQLASLPVLAGAREAMQAGIFSTLQEPNRQACLSDCSIGSDLEDAAALLFDPQTSGGLLMAVPEHHAGECLQALEQAGYAAARIGAVVPREPGQRALAVLA